MSRLVTLPLVLALLACSGVMQLPAASENRAACVRYVDHMNELSECLGLVYDASNLCPGVDAEPVDMTPFYDCLVAHSSCEGGQPRLDVDGCEAPVSGLVAQRPPEG
jgi:hypothetical protein